MTRDDLRGAPVRQRPCAGCGTTELTEARVYFGVFGPFCSVACREKWARKKRGEE